ncbi:MAG: aminotransferase class V-fold PLP-dependent enzyme, partial [Verrucomicrobia bacterium]|nr:aminotransferase class V-fold PLP-dependent enzyme [Verrucomicrobiota bacterium]
MLGPTGIGVLYGRLEVLERMEPFLTGGEMISRVTLEDSTWADLPQKFEAGTPHVSGAIGLGVAVDYLQRVGMETIRDYDERLARYAIGRLEQIPGVRIFGRAPERSGAVSF